MSSSVGRLDSVDITSDDDCLFGHGGAGGGTGTPSRLTVGLFCVPLESTGDDASPHSSNPHAKYPAAAFATVSDSSVELVHLSPRVSVRSVDRVPRAASRASSLRCLRKDSDDSDESDNSDDDGGGGGGNAAAPVRPSPPQPQRVPTTHTDDAVSTIALSPPGSPHRGRGRGRGGASGPTAASVVSPLSRLRPTLQLGLCGSESGVDIGILSFKTPAPPGWTREEAALGASWSYCLHRLSFVGHGAWCAVGLVPAAAAHGAWKAYAFSAGAPRGAAFVDAFAALAVILAYVGWAFEGLYPGNRLVTLAALCAVYAAAGVAYAAVGSAGGTAYGRAGAPVVPLAVLAGLAACAVVGRRRYPCATAAGAALGALTVCGAGLQAAAAAAVVPALRRAAAPERLAARVALPLVAHPFLAAYAVCLRRVHRLLPPDARAAMSLFSFTLLLPPKLLSLTLPYGLMLAGEVLAAAAHCGGDLLLHAAVERFVGRIFQQSAPSPDSPGAESGAGSDCSSIGALSEAASIKNTVELAPNVIKRGTLVVPGQVLEEGEQDPWSFMLCAQVVLARMFAEFGTTLAGTCLLTAMRYEADTGGDDHLLLSSGYLLTSLFVQSTGAVAVALLMQRQLRLPLSFVHGLLGKRTHYVVLLASCTAAVAATGTPQVLRALVDMDAR